VRSAATAPSTIRDANVVEITTHRHPTAALTARRTSSSVVVPLTPMRMLSGRPTIRRYVIDAGSRWSVARTFASVSVGAPGMFRPWSAAYITCPGGLITLPTSQKVQP
jgi:hypothetical protein